MKSGLLLGALLGLLIAAAPNAETMRQVDANGRVIETSAEQTSQQADVMMFATAWCPRCAEAREYFRSKGIRYTEYDIEDNPGAREQWRMLGGRGVPLIVVGDHYMSGFSPERFQSLYAAATR